jgi:uncharacterized protein YneF (UPF0154 family)
MQPTMIEMMVEQQGREQERKRQENLRIRGAKPSRKPIREILGNLFK